MKKLPLLSLSICTLLLLLFFHFVSKSYAVGPGQPCTDPSQCDPATTNGNCAPLSPGSTSLICGFKSAAPPVTQCTIHDSTTACTKNEQCCTPETTGQCITLAGGGFVGQKICAPASKVCTIKDTTTTCQNDSDCCTPDTAGACNPTTKKCQAKPVLKCWINDATTACTNDSDCCANSKILAQCVPNATGIGPSTCQTVASAGNPPPPLPPPPLPPCSKLSGGLCMQIDSAFGPFSTDPGGFITKIFAILLSSAGGIALLLIMRAGYQLMTSQGKPEAIQQGREQLIAAIVGLMFLIFSFVILEIIGVDILRIPDNTAGFTIIQKGGICDVAGNNPCVSGTKCVSNGGRSGICQ